MRILSLQSLVENWKNYGVNVSELITLAGIRQRDLIDERKKGEIAAARGILKLQTPMLLTTSKVIVNDCSTIRYTNINNIYRYSIFNEQSII